MALAWASGNPKTFPARASRILDAAWSQNAALLVQCSGCLAPSTCWDQYGTEIGKIARLAIKAALYTVPESIQDLIGNDAQQIGVFGTVH